MRRCVIARSKWAGKIVLQFKNHARKIYGEVRVKLDPFEYVALNGSEWVASYSLRFSSGERAIDASLMGDGMGPRAGLYALARSICPCR
jgi:hypothetical protein